MNDRTGAGAYQNAIRTQGRFAARLLGACTPVLMCLTSDETFAVGTVSAVKTANKIFIEAGGGAVTYKAIVDEKSGGNITELSLPVDGKVVVRNVADIFYYGTH